MHAYIVLHEAEHLKAEARDLKASNQALMKEIEELKTLAVAASQSATRRRLSTTWCSVKKRVYSNYLIVLYLMEL